MFFKQKNHLSNIQKTLLSDTELFELRAFAEQLDCSSIPHHQLESRSIGSLPTRAVGSGIDYAESRVYQAGDDTRTINWRLSARSHETFVKTFHIESRPSLNLFLDKRRSMFFGTRERLKVTQAIRVASLLAYAADLHQLKFQAWILNDDGVQYFDNYEDFLIQANVSISIQVLNSYSNNNNITPVLHEMNQRVAKGSLLYLISDYCDLEKSDQAELARLNEQSFVQVIYIKDKAELNLPTLGKYRLQDMQKERSYKLDSQKELELQRFNQYSLAYFEKKHNVFKELGFSIVELMTDVNALQDKISLPLGYT